MRINQQSKYRDGWSLKERDPQIIESFMPYWGWFYQYYFRVQTEGWHHIPPQEPVLIVGSHNGGLASPDMIMMMYDWFRYFGTQRLVYGLMHPHVWKVYPDLARLAAKTGAVVAHPKMAIAALRQGASILVYPGGAQDVFRPHAQRGQINFAGRKGFIKIALKHHIPIVPAISTGAHDTLIVLADFYPQVKQFLQNFNLPWLFNVDPEVFPIYLGLPWGIGIGPLPNFPLPVPIRTRVCVPIVFEHYGEEAASDRNYINACYQLVVERMQQELNQLINETSDYDRSNY
jgi:1-acyl-sn-glycerol-3-phosphate acyltransferase